ncbi:MAG TPA: hypothetical protein VM012_06805 [Flavitalea sp.]|nr:hypothetical protein [Flavitalea sp.]
MKDLFTHFKFLVFNVLFLSIMAAKGHSAIPFIPSKLLEPKTVLIVLKSANAALRKKLEGNIKKPVSKFYKGNSENGENC